MTDTTPTSVPVRPKQIHFGRHIGIRHERVAVGRGRCVVELAEHHLNPNAVVHGGVAYSMVDQAMGTAVYSTLAPGEAAITIEIKINYLRAARDGQLLSEGWLVERVGDVAHLEAEVRQGDNLIAKGLGTYMVLAPKRAASAQPEAAAEPAPEPSAKPE